MKKILTKLGNLTWTQRIKLVLAIGLVSLVACGILFGSFVEVIQTNPDPGMLSESEKSLFLGIVATAGLVLLSLVAAAGIYLDRRKYPNEQGLYHDSTEQQGD